MEVLIADSSEEFRRAVEQALEQRYRVHCCGTGREALDLLCRLRPEILVLDLMLPELDGLSILQTLAPNGLPKVLATTSLLSAYIQETAQSLGVDYVMRKPCSIETVVMRVEDMAGYSADIKKQLAGILQDLGFASKIDGTRCLPDTLDLYAQNPGQALTKELYPAVGKRCSPKATGQKVEKDIRYAIQTAWTNGDAEQWRSYFPEGKRPTNGEFLQKMVQVLKLREKAAPK